MRLLDVGCGWGSLLIHAASNYGVEAVGVTLSRRQAELAAKRIAEAGLTERVTVRLQDNGGPTKTLALRAGSPALDKVPPGGAGCTATDQRGIARPQGPACDIGAFELAVVPFNSARPRIKGRPVNGRRLRASRGRWLFNPTGFKYRWQRCKRAPSRPGLTGPS